MSFIYTQHTRTRTRTVINYHSLAVDFITMFGDTTLTNVSEYNSALNDFSDWYR